MAITKQHILDEIKRLALANDGKAPGREVFLKETGIKAYECLGKYWVRWSDAIREAGLQPNQLNQAYPEELLLDHMVSLIRKIGKFPSNPEIQFESRNRKEFPARTTYETRFGSKTQLASAVIAYCKQKGGLDDVLDLCSEAIRPELETREESDDEIEWGFVYLFKSGRNYKIGQSNSPGRREYELRTQMPERLEKIHEIKTDDPLGIEAYWHNRFASKRKNGEWFALDAADIKTFKRRKLM